MHRLVATRAPASAPREPRRMICAADENARASVLLEVAFDTKRRVARHEHLVIDRTVRRMAGGAPFAHRLVFKDERAELLHVTFGAGLVFLQ